MAKRTLRQRIIAGLEARGEKFVKKTGRYDVYTCTPANSFYYVGHVDALRRGSTVRSSIHLPGLRAKILEEQI